MDNQILWSRQKWWPIFSFDLQFGHNTHQVVCLVTWINILQFYLDKVQRECRSKELQLIDWKQIITHYYERTKYRCTEANILSISLIFSVDGGCLQWLQMHALCMCIIMGLPESRDLVYGTSIAVANCQLVVSTHYYVLYEPIIWGFFTRAFHK